MVTLARSAAMYPADDVDMWTRLADEHLVLALPQRLLEYRVHPRSASSSGFTQQLKRTLLIEENARRRRQGDAELDVAAYEVILAAQPRVVRARRWLEWRSRYCYRTAGGFLADRRPVGLAWLAASFVLQPLVPLERLRRQVVPRIGEAFHRRD